MFGGSSKHDTCLDQPATPASTTLPAETRHFFIPNGNAHIPADYHIGHSCPIQEGRGSAKSLNSRLLCGGQKCLRSFWIVSSFEQNPGTHHRADTRYASQLSPLSFLQPPSFAALARQTLRAGSRNRVLHVYALNISLRVS
jgi:hypothetical protein